MRLVVSVVDNVMLEVVRDELVEVSALVLLVVALLAVEVVVATVLVMLELVVMVVLAVRVPVEVVEDPGTARVTSRRLGAQSYQLKSTSLKLQSDGEMPKGKPLQPSAKSRKPRSQAPHVCMLI